MTEDLGQKLGIDWLKTIAGALAAVSSAVLLSTLGAAGTIIGAALGSVVVTVGGALYSQGLARSRARLAQVPLTPRRKVVTVADERPAPGRRDRLRTLPWKRISLTAAALFAATVVAITAFELATGRTLSSFTGGSDGGGGTTLTRIGGGSHGGPSPSPDDRSPSGGETSPSPESSDPATPTEQASPTEQTSPTDRGSPFLAPTEPTDGATDSPSDSTSPAPTPASPTTPTLPPELTTTPPPS